MRSNAPRKLAKKTITRERHRDIGAEMIQGMREAITFERGAAVDATFKAAPISARHATVVPAIEFSPADIAALRMKLGLSQSLFARALNVSAETEKAWEQGKSPPNGASKRLLEIVMNHPRIFLEGVIQVGAGVLRPSTDIVDLE